MIAVFVLRSAFGVAWWISPDDLPVVQMRFPEVFLAGQGEQDGLACFEELSYLEDNLCREFEDWSGEARFRG